MVAVFMNERKNNTTSLPQESFSVESAFEQRIFRILVVDDDSDARDLLDIALASPKYELKLCATGQEALDAYPGFRPDLLILDWHMPDISGVKICKQIKSSCGRTFIPVILLTSLAEIADRVTGLNYGADEYITKPFALPELEARVRAMLRIKILADELKRTQDLVLEKEKQLVAMQVAGAACHELGQPLTTIMLNYKLLNQFSPTDPKFMQALETVVQQCQRMGAILKKLTELSKYKTKPYARDLDIIDLNAR